MNSILIANRGEIAIRVAQAAAELGLQSVSVYTQDDANCLHVNRSDRAVALAGQGPAGYLDIEAIVQAAIASGCDAVHPGYGFLSESPQFARALEQAGITFIGPTATVLDQLGDKASALALARQLKTPVNPGLPAGASLEEIRQFMVELGGPVILKAVAGGGGRGMRVVTKPDDIATALNSAASEAQAAFGNSSIFVERYLPRARHIEVQIIGDGSEVVHVWERDCTLQRRHQKIVEIAPAPGLDAQMRQTMLNAAVGLTASVHYRGLGTVEFLVGADGTVAFIEVNPRVQVEHTVTEAITGIDLVAAQIQIAGGASLAQLGLQQVDIPNPQGAAVQVRVNLEKMNDDGTTLPTGGLLTAYEPPGGPGVRVDGHGYAGLRTSPRYDSLLAKVITHASTGLPDALIRAQRALRSFRIEGVETNIALLHVLLGLPQIPHGDTYTGQIEDQAEALLAASVDAPAALLPAPSSPVAGAAGRRPNRPGSAATDDPLGVLDYGRETQNSQTAADLAAQEPGALSAPMQGTILAIQVSPGDTVSRGAELFVMEAMKMQHSIRAQQGGTIRQLSVQVNDTVYDGDLLAILDLSGDHDTSTPVESTVDLDAIRPDLQELHDRKALIQDAARPASVQKRHKLGKRTARENVAQLCDPNSLIEYGDLTFAAQRVRRSLDDLIRNTPADGLITGFATVNAGAFGPKRSRTAVLAYDYTVLAGTQGIMNHAKKDRMIAVIKQQQTPLVFFCEGGGGRPGDVDASDTSIAGLHIHTFWRYAQLSGLVPMIGIASGRLFAGNAALLGCCDVVIATRDACIGMGGPAMIEGGGLGLFRPEDVGPTDVQAPNGVIDILVEDEVQAVDVAKQYLSYFQGRLDNWTAPDNRTPRHVVPENRLQVYDVHQVIEAIADVGSVLEIRAAFAPGMVTAFVRIEGRPVGIVANNPIHLAGAIDSPGADKGSRFLKLCDAFDMPVVSLVDTPGMMVGPEIEKTALVRHCCRMFLVGANLSVPLMSFVLRKSYGLGAQAMTGGSFRTPLFCVGWPTAEIGAMGLEGAVKLGYRKELEAITDVDERKALFDKMVAESYERGKAINAASVLEFDTVIDPADTRQWICAALDAAPPPAARTGKKNAFVDSW